MQKKSSLSLILLAIANIVTIALFIQSHGSIIQVLWCYWLQSVIIGIFNVGRILEASSSTITEKIGLALFFCVHYSMFHFIYAVFLISFSAPNSNIMKAEIGSKFSLVSVLICGALFTAHHLISYIEERYRLKNNLETLTAKQAIMQPYSRILPMHLIIISGPIIATLFGNAAVFIVFMLIKTFVDLKLHLNSPRQA